MLKENTCSSCGRKEYSDHFSIYSAENLPYEWCYLTEEVSGVHDSATVVFTYKYILCGQCRSNFRKILEGKVE